MSSGPIVRRLPLEGPASFGRGSRSPSSATRPRSKARACSCWDWCCRDFCKTRVDQFVHRNGAAQLAARGNMRDGQRGSAVGRSSDQLARALAKAPEAFDFHVAMRRLEAHYREKPRFGEAVCPPKSQFASGKSLRWRLRHLPFERFEFPRTAKLGRLTIAFFGLFGPRGAAGAPHRVCARRMRNAADRTFVAFADIFHHRMALLFHRAWAACQPTSAHDRPSPTGLPRTLGR